MGLKKYIKKYKNYETKELARRVAKKKRVESYKDLVRTAKKKNLVKKVKRKFDAKKFTKAIGNPYKIKF